MADMERYGSGRRTFLKTAGAASLVGLAGCNTTDDGGNGGGDDGGGDETDGGVTGTTGQAEDIVIGNVTPLTGPFTPWGQAHKAGLEFAIQEINNDGGVLGRNMAALSQDTAANPQDAATAFRRLVNNEGAVAVTGPVSSDVGIRVRRVAEELQVPHLPNQASAPRLLSRDTRYTFRVAGTATPTFANAAASLIQERGYSNYGALIADYSYGHSYQAGLEQYIEPIDGLNSTIKVAPVGADDFTSYLRQLPDDLEYLDVAGHPVGIFSIVQQAEELGLDAEIRGGPNIPTPLFYEVLQEQITNGITLYPAVDPTTDEYAEVASRYAEENDALFGLYQSFGYVTGKLLATAIEDAGSAESQAIRDAISGIDYDSILAHPSISYTEWGELENAKLVGMQFTSEAPSYYPDGNYGFETVFETEPFEPIDPANW